MGNTEGAVGVVIVHYGDPEPTHACLRSIEQDPSRTTRFIVVVDNSGNLSAEVVGSGVTLVPSVDNPGFGAGVNRGAEVLQEAGDFSVYVALNNDVVIAPGYLDAALSALQPGVAAVAGPIYLDRIGERLWYAGGRVNFLTGTVLQDRTAKAATRARKVGFLPGTAFGIRPEAWRQVGGFDPEYFLYNEDLDLCLRLRRLGWTLCFEPRMVSVHRLGGTTGSRERSPLYLEHLARSRLRPFRPWPYRLYLAGIHTGYNLLRGLRLYTKHGSAAQPYVAALSRGHLHAVRELLRRFH
jgi:N-acetylglucosaminyl-diphospho-decaprenol L-rhamnosyltransferase